MDRLFYTNSVDDTPTVRICTECLGLALNIKQSIHNIEDCKWCTSGTMDDVQYILWKNRQSDVQ